ncbi:hypothetical protein C8F04DRAFT_1399066 [Mycena alexandri]|uniref:F-box domain-containing protein n=1 Tax=Mycena alexandri TaxID=1745969 RepID=A0AAD6WXH4_9AGAR|nr:hypothetical protein C8F04DRAFT_1399066 [Mycena alexandri]
MEATPVLSEPESTPQGIQSLPLELICAIFSVLHTSSTRKAQKMAPVHTLTRVCRFWREISQGLPELWTDIRIFHCRPGHPNMLGEYLRRSNLLPIDILLQVSSDVAANQMAEFWSAILGIWAVSARWRTLHIITTAKNFSAMKYNVGRKDAPLLESLELRVSKSQSSYQPSLSFGSMPLLRSLVVHEIAPQISDTADFVGQLETLDLFGASTCTHLVVDLAQHFEDSSQDTQVIPRLRHLSLRSGLPSLYGAFGVAFKSYISFLTTLRMGNFRDHNFQTLCSLLSTPFLEELTLHDLTHACWTTFTGTLRDQHLTFPALRTLKLSSITQCSFHRHLIDAFPALEHLSLLDTASPTFFSALSKPESPSYPILWPHLRSLALDNADYRALCIVVEARSAMGHSVDILQVDTPQFIDAVSLQWLQKHVKTLKRNPRRPLDSTTSVLDATSLAHS